MSLYLLHFTKVIIKGGSNLVMKSLVLRCLHVFWISKAVLQSTALVWTMSKAKVCPVSSLRIQMSLSLLRVLTTWSVKLAPLDTCVSPALGD